MSKLYCAHLLENWLRLGIARSNKFVGLCARLAQTFVLVHGHQGVAQTNPPPTVGNLETARWGVVGLPRFLPKIKQ